MRLALVHGFTQTAASWATVRAGLEARGHQILTPELAGHGAAGALRADLPTDAARLADATESAPLAGAPVWLGYSMGGRICLHLAIERPVAVRGLVLVSTTAGIDDEVGRADRRRADGDLARSIEADGVAAFVERWLAGPLWATLDREAAGIDARLANTAAGLAASLRLAGTGTQAPLWDRLGEVAVPVLIVTGTRDPKFSALGARLEASFTSAPVTRVQVDGAGHAVPWERPARMVEIVDHWTATAFNRG